MARSGWFSEVLRKVGARALSISRFFPRRGKHRRGRKAHLAPPFRRKVVFEMLEQRLLLSADPLAAVDIDKPADHELVTAILEGRA